MSNIDPYKELEGEQYDCVIVGTSLPNAIYAAQQSLLNKKILVISTGIHYGDPHFASTEEGLNGFKIDRDALVLSNSGMLVETLVETGAGVYVQFEPIKGILLFDEGTKRFKQVPLSKEAVMMDEDIPLKDKRALMKAISDLVLTENVKDMIENALGWPKDLSSELCSFVQGLGKYNQVDTDRCTVLSINSAPYLIPVYGASDIVQAFCRVAAVHGATFVMGQQQISVEDNYVRVKGDCEWSVRCENILTEEVTNDTIFGSSIIFTREHPLIDEPGCWLIRLCSARISVLQLDSSSLRCPRDSYLFHAWSDAHIQPSDLHQLLDWSSINWFQVHDRCMNVTLGEAEKSLFGALPNNKRAV